ncbi:hypothetical protein HPB51_017974 [Rhipicephalus microplus]|uniref:Uncharacterized protein n=1 Tax=Rhipicephalus microplus TaxID=6941 RepID=A0A9J6D5J8_RHIMP|nr:hypothetical protein HPB51_017974 [Rhipicephalus microplus]
MGSGQRLERQRGKHTHRTDGAVLAAFGDFDEDTRCLEGSGKSVDDISLHRSAYASVFNVASPSITGIPGNLFPSWPRLRSADRPGNPWDAAYLLELDTWAEIKYRRTAALRGYICSLSKLKRAGLQLSSHPSRRLYVGANKDNATSDPHFGHSSFSDAEQYARYREPPAIDLDRGNVHIVAVMNPWCCPTEQ